MKTIIVILLLAFSLPSKAQLQIGGRIGTNFANLENIDEAADNYTTRQAFYGGFIFNYQLNPELFLQPEINFSSEGGTKKELQMIPVGTVVTPGTTTHQPVYANLKTTTIIHYLEVPVLAKFIAGKKIKYFLCAGPYVSFLLDAKQKASGNSIVYLDEAGTKTLVQNTTLHPEGNSYFNYETKISNSIENFNFGFIGGCGAEFKSGPGKFFVDCRLKLGMTNINAYPANDGKHQTTCISLSTGYLIKIK